MILVSMTRLPGTKIEDVPLTNKLLLLTTEKSKCTPKMAQEKKDRLIGPRNTGLKQFPL